MSGCDATAESMSDPKHTHTCAGHDSWDNLVDHFCPFCQRWWWKK